MKTFALVLAFATFYVASVDAGLVTRQAEKGRRIVRIRGRQREDRQLFLDPVAVPLTLNQPGVVIPAPIAQPLIQPLPQPILQRVVQPVVQPILQPVVQQVQQPVQLVEVREVVAEEPRQASQGYGAPAEEVEVAIEEARQAPQGYGAPVAAETPAVVEVRAEPNPSYLAPELLSSGSAVIEVRQQPAQFSVPQTVATEGLVRLKPIAITRSVYNAPGAQPGNDNWNYAFESENGIKQQALGEVRSIDNSDVLVMRGSYEYIGADSLVYVVNWEADENGFRATAPHLPQPVAIPFPEQQAAVDAQIRFAAEEDALRLRSGSLPAYADQ